MIFAETWKVISQIGKGSWMLECSCCGARRRKQTNELLSGGIYKCKGLKLIPKTVSLLGVPVTFEEAAEALQISQAHLATIVKRHGKIPDGKKIFCGWHGDKIAVSYDTKERAPQCKVCVELTTEDIMSVYKEFTNG